jgi:hypothetical protein
LAALQALAPHAGLAQVPRPDAAGNRTFAAAWQRGTSSMVSGELTVMYADDFANHRAERLYFVKDRHSGRVVQVQFEKQPADLRTGTVVTLTGRASDSQLYVLAGQTDDWQASAPVRSSVPAAAVTGDPAAGHRTLVMVGDFTDACVDCSISAIADALFTDAGGLSVAGLYQDNSLGQVALSGDVVGPYPIDFGSGGACDLGGWANAIAAQAAASGVDLSAYQRRVYVLPRGTCPAAGYATVGGAPSSAWVFLCNLKGLFAHELGHNLGLEHAGTPTSEYDDGTDPMGLSSGALRGLNAPHRHQLGWAGGQAVQTVSESGRYDLASLALDPSQVTAPQVIRIAKPDTGDYYYLSYRSSVGFDQYIDWWYYNRLSLHRYKGDGSASKTHVLAGLADGERFVDPVNGVAITLVSHTPTSATASVELACVGTPPSLTLSPGALAAAPGGTVTYSGSLTNLDASACPATTFSMSVRVASGWSATLSQASLPLAAGASGPFTLTVTSPSTAPAGNYAVAVAADDALSAGRSVSSTVSYSVLVTDAVPPTVPTGLRANVNQKPKQIQLSWSPASDNVGIAGYRVRKNGVVVGASTTTGWVDPAYAGGSYTVAAYDAAGNVSAPSEVVTVTIPGGRKR